MYYSIIFEEMQSFFMIFLLFGPLFCNDFDRIGQGTLPLLFLTHGDWAHTEVVRFVALELQYLGFGLCCSAEFLIPGLLLG